MDTSSASYHQARKERIMMMANPAGRGLEIGPSHNPVAPKAAGYDVEIVDHTDQQGLIDKYRNDVGINLANIEPVDHVWTGGSLCELIGRPRSYDWIVASHVIEHMPDLLFFLKECQSLLKEDGILSLVVPDKRFCFDHLRARSTTGGILQAHLERRTRHTPGQVFDHFAGACKLGETGAWHRDSAGRIDLLHDPALAHAMYGRSMETSGYLDVHGWVFTPSSFRLIMHDLNELGCIHLNEVAFTDTRDCEFFLAYSNAPVSSRPDRLALAKQALHEERQAYFP